MNPTVQPGNPDDEAPGSPLAQRVLGVIMALVLAFGFWQGVAAMMTPSAERRLAPTLDTESLLAGRTAAAVNYIMAHYLPADGVFRAAGGIFRWRLFGSGGPQVAVGCNDWLYLMEELRPWPGADAAMQQRADTLGQVAARLKEKGIDLIVALVPDKARVVTEMRCGVPLAAENAGRYAAFAALVRGKGVPLVDLNAVLSAPRAQPSVFWRTDTHWSQVGAALAARAIATAVTTPIGHGYEYRTEAAADETDGPGDLLRLMSLDKVPDVHPRLRPLPDRQHLEKTVQTKAPAASGGLLDEGATAEVVLVGSSYSLNANFVGRLQEALRAQVGSFAEAGGGFASSARKYLTSPAFRETPPKVVVWEIPERVVGQPLTEADRTLVAGW